MTPEGKQVIGGLFPLVSSEGILLEVIVQELDSKNYVVDWFDFWTSSVKSGWNPRSTRTKILCCIGEQFGPKVREQHEKILDFLYELEMAKKNEDEPKMIELLLEHRKLEQKEQRQRLLNTLHKRA